MNTDEQLLKVKAEIAEIRELRERALRYVNTLEVDLNVLLKKFDELTEQSFRESK